jgi:hypothetical protein
LLLLIIGLIVVFVVFFADGFVYERDAIQEWLVSRRRTSPMTNLPVVSIDLVPLDDLRKEIQQFLAKSTM